MWQVIVDFVPMARWTSQAKPRWLLTEFPLITCRPNDLLTAGSSVLGGTAPFFDRIMIHIESGFLGGT